MWVGARTHVVRVWLVAFVEFVGHWAEQHRQSHLPPALHDTHSGKHPGVVHSDDGPNRVGRLELPGRVQHVDDSPEQQRCARPRALSSGGNTLGSSCPFNSETDAVIPFVLNVHNTTSSFSLTSAWEVIVTATAPAADGEALDLLVEGDGQPQCAGAGQVSGSPITNFRFNQQPGQSTQVGGFLILPNYFSPASPTGSPSILTDIAFQVVGTANDDVNGTPSMLSGMQTGSVAAGNYVSMPVLAST